MIEINKTHKDKTNIGQHACQMNQHRTLDSHDKMVGCCLGGVAGGLDWALSLETAVSLVVCATEQQHLNSLLD